MSDREQVTDEMAAKTVAMLRDYATRFLLSHGPVEGFTQDGGCYHCGCSTFIGPRGKLFCTCLCSEKLANMAAAVVPKESK